MCEFSGKNRKLSLWRKGDKTFSLHYDTVKGKFLGLYKTLGYIVVRGNPEEYLLDYGFSKEISKILYSYHKKAYQVCLVEHSSIAIRWCLKQGVYRLHFQIFFILPSTTDRSKQINRYLGSVNLLPIDGPVNSFETKKNVVFDPSKLDFANQKKEIMTGVVVKMLKKLLMYPTLTLSKMQMYYYQNLTLMLEMNR